MNIAMITHCSPEYRDVGRVSLPLWERYCGIHGYVLDVDEGPGGHEAPWRKMERIRAAVEKYDLVHWVGADTLCTNPSRTIEGEWESQGKPAAIFTADVYGINADSMIWSNSVHSRMLAYAVCTMGRHWFSKHGFAEQMAISQFVYWAPYRDHVRIIPQKGMNSYVHELYGRPSSWPGNWELGDWILHVPGLSLDQRARVLREHVELTRDLWR